jgi:putative transposase
VDYPVRVQCSVLDVSRSGYYRWRSRSESRRAGEDRSLSVKIRAKHEESRCLYGSPRIHAALRQQGERCGRKRVARLMLQQGLQSQRRRRFRTTTRAAARPAAPNWLDRQWGAVKGCNRVWVGDITYLWTQEGWHYLAVLLDAYSRRIVGWADGSRLHEDLCLRALQAALKQRRPPQGLLHHSDRGSQYTGMAYQGMLARQGVEPSMSRTGNCYDNALAESFFSTLKAELKGFGRFATRQDAHRALFDYIERYYNSRRLHSSLGYRSPAEFKRLERGGQGEGEAQQERKSVPDGLSPVVGPDISS